MRVISLNAPALIAGLLLGCAGPATPPAVSKPEFALGAALVALREAPRECEDTCCFEARLRALRSRSTPGTSDALVDSARTPAQRAAVIERSSARRDPQDLDWIERALSQDVIAWDEPKNAATQAAVGCPSALAWAPVSVSQVALRALGRIVGRRFESLKEWRAWRTAHPHAQRSAGFWQSRLPSPQTEPACESISDKIGAQDVDLLIRLSVALHHRFNGRGPAKCVGPARLRPHADRILAALENPEKWRADPDASYAEDTRWSHLAVWAFSDAPALFSTEQRERLFGLAKKPHLAGDPGAFAALAAALVRLDPQRGAPILKRAMKRSPEDLLLVFHFARLHPDDVRISGWLQRWDASPCARDTVATATVRGLSQALDGPAGRARLVNLVKGRSLSRRPRMLRALANVARSEGASALECRTELHHPNCMKLTKKDRQDRLERFERAKSQCWTALRRHYVR